jgi:hypothetical protein
MEGEVLEAAPLCDEKKFELECWRLWEETVQTVGSDPMGVSNLLWEIVNDPFSSPMHMPAPNCPKPEKKPTPEILAQLARRPIT